MVHGIVGCYRIQGLLKGEKLNLYPDIFLLAGEASCLALEVLSQCRK